MENDKNYDEHLCDLRDELVAQRIQEKRYLKNESIKVFIENIDDNKYQYIFRNLIFNDDKDDLLKYLLNSEYYIDVVYPVLGIEKGNYKVYINDFDHITNTSEVEFKDLQYISKINDEYEFYEEEPNKQKLEDLFKIDINTKASTINENNRYIKLKNVGNSNNIRDLYIRSLQIGGQEEELYDFVNLDNLDFALKGAGEL